MSDPVNGPLAQWMHDQMVRIRDARVAGDGAQIRVLLAELGERDPRARALAEQAMAAAYATEAGIPGPFPVGANLDGKGLCDFCAAVDPPWFFPMAEFEIAGNIGSFLSGDRMYACTPCRDLIDAGDWPGVKRRTGSTALNPGVALLWSGFRMNRTGPAQPA